MRRLQLFEFLDQAWLPTFLREGATDFLEAITSRGDIYRPIQAEFFRAIDACRPARVVDLCSGGGGPWLSPPWRSSLQHRAPLAVVLTDKFPSDLTAVRSGDETFFRSVAYPVDAADVPENLRGFRTIFSSFHHFPDALARAVLKDAVRCGDGFAMAEVTVPTPRAFATMLSMPVLVWLLTPRIRPFRWSRVLFTYLVPVIPLVVMWDGLVSCLRTRTPRELLALASSFPQYDWIAGYARDKKSWLTDVYLIGRPRTVKEDPPAQQSRSQTEAERSALAATGSQHPTPPLALDFLMR